MTIIEGVVVENPTAIWMQLKNTRQRVLTRQDKWHPGGWFEDRGHHSPYTMCLANAVRFVVHGQASKPEQFSRDREEMDVAEALVLQAINLGNQFGDNDDQTYPDIPEFNDQGGRRWREIVQVLDRAIAMVGPYAKAEATVFADEVMTPAELKEIREATWKAEDAMWMEYSVEWGLRQDERGVWRNRKGRYAPKPSPRVSKRLSKLEREEIALDAKTEEFRNWLDDHQERGWDTFWDELLDCGDDQKCKDAVLALA